jgi:virginiamycin B lyase
MLSFAGHQTSFPILPPDRTAAPTAAYLARHLTPQAVEKAVASYPPLPAPPAAYQVTEWDLPQQMDFPHDLMLDRRGGVYVTGMFSGLMYRLDPASGRFTTLEIPVPGANPRALDIDRDGDLWVLLGFPHKLARYRVDAKQWDVYDIGMYGHSVGVDAKKRAWFNGHFTRDPILFGYVDAATGKTHTLEAPPTPMPEAQGGPIPYELRVGADNTVWMTELAGNRLLRHDPADGGTKAYPLPAAHSGPRRCDVGPDGRVWVPEFAGGKLAVFDPRKETFEEFDFPVRDSLPYCARVDHRRGVVWISQCGADAIARFDTRTKTFAEFELPTRNAFIRHLDIDAETGEVWAAYSHSPNLEMRIVRLRTER